jgi:hypothetical protein
LIERLKEGEVCDGTLQEDSAIFLRAVELSEHGARTEVWQVAVELDDDAWEEARQRALQWYTDGTTFSYAFPARGQPSPVDGDNCATFPRRFGIHLPEPTGQLARYIPILQSIGERWKPKEE